MTIERAIEILDPEHREHYDSIEPVNEACRMGMNALKELAELKAKIKSGLLVELPCKVGDTVYYIEYFCRSKGCSRTDQMCCCGCPEMLERERKKETYVVREKKFQLKDLIEVNKTIYLTKEAAEAQLKEASEARLK